MTLRSIGLFVLATLLLVACGPSSAQIKSARTARYNASASEVFQAAVAGLKDNQPVDKADPVTSTAYSKGRWYEGDGTYVAKDANDNPVVTTGAVVVAFEVKVVPDGAHFGVEVIPHVQQYRDGYSALFEIQPGSEQMPGFIIGLTDSIYLSIHGRLKGNVVVPSGAAAPGAVAPATP
jgi:hypothetical protein